MSHRDASRKERPRRQRQMFVHDMTAQSRGTHGRDAPHVTLVVAQLVGLSAFGLEARSNVGSGMILSRLGEHWRLRLQDA
jgi:hypothetical protein